MKTRLTFIRSSLILLFTGLFVQVGVAQDSLAVSNISSPWHTIYNHLWYLQEESYSPEKAVRSISPKIKDPAERVDLAIKLKQVLDGKGIYVDLDIISKEPNFLDSAHSIHRYYVSAHQLPELYVEKVGNEWFYSSRSIGLVDQWHGEVFPFGTARLLKMMPKDAHSKYLGLYLWQYVGLFIIVLLTFVFHRVFTFLLEKIFTRALRLMGYKKLADNVLLRVAKPVSILILFPILIILIPVLQLPIKMNSFVILGLRVVWPVFAVIFFYRLGRYRQ